VKLYFMCGLPTETDGDVLEIGSMAHDVIRAGRAAAGSKDVRCTVSIGAFVPKPHTPFQWAAQCGHETVDARLRALGAAAKLPGIDGGIVTTGPLVSLETAQYPPLCNDPRLRLSGLQERLEPERMIEVTMREDRSVDRRRRLLAQQRGERGRERRHPGIDQHDALIGLERGHAAEPRLEPGSFRDLDWTAGPEELRLLRALVALARK